MGGHPVESVTNIRVTCFETKARVECTSLAEEASGASTRKMGPHITSHAQSSGWARGRVALLRGLPKARTRGGAAGGTSVSFREGLIGGVLAGVRQPEGRRGLDHEICQVGGRTPDSRRVGIAHRPDSESSFLPLSLRGAHQPDQATLPLAEEHQP